MYENHIICRETLNIHFAVDPHSVITHLLVDLQVVHQAVDTQDRMHSLSPGKVAYLELVLPGIP